MPNNEVDASPVSCNSCDAVLGYKDDQAEGLRLHKLSLALSTRATSHPQIFAPSKWLSCHLLSAIETQGVRKFIFSTLPYEVCHQHYHCNSFHTSRLTTSRSGSSHQMSATVPSQSPSRPEPSKSTSAKPKQITSISTLSERKICTLRLWRYRCGWKRCCLACFNDLTTHFRTK